MDDLLKEGMHVQLDVLRIERLRVNDADTPADLSNRELRRLVENWMIVKHQRNGFKMLSA